MAYERQVFIDGQTKLSKQHLDHIEGGIAAAHESISNLSKEIYDLKGNGTGGTVDSSLFETVPCNNLFDKNKLVTSFVDKDGKTVTGTFTNYIKIDLNKRYVTNLNYTQFHFFDENKVHLSSATYISNPQVITGNGGYLLVKLGSDYSNAKVLEGTDIDAYHESYTRLKNDFNKWFGKRWLCIGDSITTDTGVYATNGYAKLISRELGMVLTNIAVSGKVMKDGYEWLDGCSSEYDLITVMLGTNNQGFNGSVGSLNDSYYEAGTYNSNSSFYAQTQLLAEKLHEKYPKSVIMLFTPIKRTAVGDSANNNDEGYQVNALGLTTEPYRDAIIDICKYYSIPYVDLYHTIEPKTETNRTLYFMSAGDGTHPNDLGHAMFLAPVIKDGIERQTPYYFNEWNNASDEETGGDDTGEDTTIPATKVTLSKSTLTFTDSATQTLVATVEPSNTTDTVVWKSSKTSVATVSNGVVTPIGNGSATITATAGSVSATCSVTVDVEEIVTYTITRNLTNCTSDSVLTSANGETSHTETLTANSGYTLDTVTVTMGGADITSTSYANGVITISSVTGNVEITASAVEEIVEDTTPVLLHRYSGTPVEFTENDTTYKKLEDTVGTLDLYQSSYMNGPSIFDYVSSDNDVLPTNIGLEEGDSFSIKVTNLYRNSAYYSYLFFLQTGIPGHMHVTSGEFVDNIGRFRFGLYKPEDVTGVFGDSKTAVGYSAYGDTSSGKPNMFIYPDTSTLFKNKETHDIAMTYDSTTKKVCVYQDGELIAEDTASVHLDCHEGIHLWECDKDCTFETLEIYKGVIEVS